MKPTRFYIAVVGFFLAALVVGAVYFVSGMGEASYLVNTGVGYGMHYIDKPRYDNNVQGLIFVLSFLAAGILLLFLVILPDHVAATVQTQAAPQPQPRRRPPIAAQPAAVPEPQPAAAPAPPPQPAAAPMPPPQPEAQAAAAQSMVEIEQEAMAAPAMPAAPAAPAAPADPAPSVDEEVLTSAPVPDVVPLDDMPVSRFEDTGEEDVVYGNGRVTDDSVWEFIHSYPDSAVKFLYRKTLENKALSPNEEDIYRRWEMRGMTRAKVREYVLEIMGWKALPDDYPHNIWREVRDQIFEMRTRVS